jgi:hypothetical protein
MSGIAIGRFLMPKDLNFKVNPDFHYRFKLAAARSDLKMKEHLYRIYKYWEDNHPKLDPLNMDYDERNM